MSCKEWLILEAIVIGKRFAVFLVIKLGIFRKLEFVTGILFFNGLCKIFLNSLMHLCVKLKKFFDL